MEDRIPISGTSTVEFIIELLVGEVMVLMDELLDILVVVLSPSKVIVLALESLIVVVSVEGGPLIFNPIKPKINAKTRTTTPKNNFHVLLIGTPPPQNCYRPPVLISFSSRK